MRLNCKTCRRLGMSVCGREKCAYKRKPYPPGVHGKAYRRGLSEFWAQLRDKQRVKFLYGLRERQFRNYVLRAISQRSVPTGEAVVASLEMRLDNITYRLGFAQTRAAARQIVNHGHVIVNGKKVTIPSHRLKVGDEIEIRSLSRQRALFVDLGATLKKYAPPAWVELDKTNFKGKVVSLPQAEDFIKSYNLSSIVEYYSR